MTKLTKHEEDAGFLRVLTKDEVTEKGVLEDKIERNLAAFYEVGAAL